MKVPACVGLLVVPFVSPEATLVTFYMLRAARRADSST